MIYTTEVFIPPKDYERINHLLSIDEHVDLDRYSCEGVYEAIFEDKSTITYDLCSGTTDFYDDVVWHKDNIDITMDCAYELDDLEVEIDGNTYKVIVNVT